MSLFSTQDLAFCRSLVHESAGLLLDERKDYLFESRLQVVVEEFGFSSMSQLVDALRLPASRKLRARVVESMTTNETSFFRDDHPFQAVRDFVLPEWKQAERRSRALRIWSAACSTGQEPYSLAMMIRDTAPELAANVKILATDLSPRVLARAREGIYTQLEVARGMPESMRARHFEKSERCWRVRAEVRQMIEFREMNLTGSWAGVGEMDLIFVRNVLIYFDLETKRAILERALERLAPGGILCLGTSETMLGLFENVETLRLGRATFYRRTGDESRVR